MRTLTVTQHLHQKKPSRISSPISAVNLWLPRELAEKNAAFVLPRLAMGLSRLLLVAWLIGVSHCWEAGRAHAREVQRHGLEFEHWICDEFFGGWRSGSYTAKWDIPAEINQEHGGIPVNPKATRWGTAVNLGDALRQFDVDEPFWLVVGFWEQDGGQKKFVSIFARVVQPEEWRALWHPVTREELLALESIVKNRNLDFREARRLALEQKRKPPFSLSVMQVNPKIDSRGQRRLQCSLRFADLFRELGEGALPQKEEIPTLWGRPFRHPIQSPPRGSRPRGE